MLANILIYTLFPILMISVVVVIHELGHYWAGRMFGAAANSFSVGFGTTLFKRMDKRGTAWQINALPLGGYVSFVDEDDEDDAPRQGPQPIGKSFYEMNVWERSVVAIAGPVANFILAIAIFAGFAMSFGVPKYKIEVLGLLEDSAAERAGLEIGDVFLTINGKPADRHDRFVQEIRLSAGDPLSFTIDRNGRVLDFIATPQRQVLEDGLGLNQKAGVLGVRFQPEIVDPNRPGLFGGIAYGVDETINSISSSLRMLSQIVTGQESVQTLSGPVGIANAVGSTARVSLEQEISLSDRLFMLLLTQLQLCALISVAVGFFNLLPLPVLDGGRLVFNAYEAVTGRMPSERVQAVSMSLTLAFLVTMAVLVTIGDFQETGLVEFFRG